MIKFFLTELRRSLRDNIVFVIMLWLALLAIQRMFSARGLADPKDIDSIANHILFITLALSFYFHGAATFTEEHRQRLWILLFTIPRSRTQIWLSLVTARATGACCGLALAISLRPALIERFADNGVLSLAAYGMPFLFVAGTAASLLSRHKIFIYSVGLVITLFFYFELLVSVAHLSRRPFEPVIALFFEDTDFQLPTENVPLNLSLLTIHLLIWISSALWLSWRIFIEGQFSHLQMQMRNMATALGVGILLLILVASGALPGIYGSIFDSQSWNYCREEITSDGRYISYIAMRDLDQRLLDVHVFSIENGKEMLATSVRGTEYLTWSKTKELFYFVKERNDITERLGLKRPVGDLWSLSLDGRLRLIREMVICFTPTKRGDIFVIPDSITGPQAEWIDETTLRSTTVLASSPFLTDLPSLSESLTGDQYIEITIAAGGVIVSTLRGSVFIPRDTSADKPLDLGSDNILVRTDGKLSAEKPLQYWTSRFGVPNTSGIDLDGAFIRPWTWLAADFFDDGSSPLFFLVEDLDQKLARIYGYNHRSDKWLAITQEVPANPAAWSRSSITLPDDLVPRPYRSIGRIFSVNLERIEAIPFDEGLVFRIQSPDGDRVYLRGSAAETTLLANGVDLDVAIPWFFRNVVTVKHQEANSCLIEYFHLQAVDLLPPATSTVPCEVSKALGVLLDLQLSGRQIWSLGEDRVGFAVLDDEGNLIREVSIK